MGLPDKKYNIIYADPPWSYNENWGNGAVKHHYETMAMQDILTMPVTDIADDNSHLYLWVTNPFLAEGLTVCKAWGFKYKQLITWIKTYNSGEPVMGLGYYFRVCTEHCIFGVKGRLPRINKSLKNLIIAPKKRHSEKPAELRDIIIAHSGDLPRIELFARHTIEGWDVWGLEVPNNRGGR